MSRGKRHRDAQHATAEQTGTDTVPETADAIDEVIAAAQDRIEQPPALPEHAAEQPAQEPATNGHAPEANGHQAATETNGSTAAPAHKSK